MDQHTSGRRFVLAGVRRTRFSRIGVFELSAAGISIVVPNWNGRALLEKFLPSLIESARAFEAACGQPTEILIADDASTDDSEEWLRANWPEVRFESSPHQQGFAPAANRGVRAARLSLVYLVNNDVALTGATLPPLAAHFRDANVFAVTGNAYDFGTGVLRGAGQRGRFRRGFLGVHSRFFVPYPPAQMQPQPLMTLYATGGSSLFDREKFLAVGGFEETLAPYGWEDVELSLRAWKQGLEVRYEPRSAIWHQFSSTIGSKVSRRQGNAVYDRNRLLTHWLHLDTYGEKAAHALGVAAKLLTSPLIGRTEYWQAFAQALAVRPQIKVRRAQWKKSQQRSLAEVLRKIEEQMSRPEVRVLDAGSAPIRPYVRSEKLSSVQAEREKTK
jgi:GT2 family glycosyltransferase